LGLEGEDFDRDYNMILVSVKREGGMAQIHRSHLDR
jgi:hypothetical protein